MKTKTILLATAFCLLSFLTFGQTIRITHERYTDVLRQFNSCAQLSQALNNGSYTLGSWRSVECTDKNGTTTINFGTVDEPKPLVKVKEIRTANRTGDVEAVDLVGSNGGTPKVWTDRRYASCKEWQIAVDNGNFEAPRGFRNITCSESSDKGIILSGTGEVKILERVKTKAISNNKRW